MSRREDERRKEDAREAALERSKRVRQFDHDVARHFSEGLSVRESARQLARSETSVKASRTWQTLSTGWAHRGGTQPHGGVRMPGPTLRRLVEARE